MDYLLRRLLRVATRRAIRGEHWAWFLLAGGAYLLRRARRREDPLVFSRRVAPGDRLLVTVRSPNREAVDQPAPS